MRPHRALELYWSGFASWLVCRLDRRWRRSELHDQVRVGILATGRAIVRGDADAVEVEPAELEWLVGVAADSRWLDDDEVATAARAIRVAQDWLRVTPAQTTHQPNQGWAGGASRTGTSGQRDPSGLTTTSETTPSS